MEVSWLYLRAGVTGPLWFYGRNMRMLDAEMDQEAGTALIIYVLLKYNPERTICVHGHGVIGAPSTVVPLQKGKTSLPRRDARKKSPKPRYNYSSWCNSKAQSCITCLLKVLLCVSRKVEETGGSLDK